MGLFLVEAWRRVLLVVLFRPGGWRVAALLREYASWQLFCGGGFGSCITRAAGQSFASVGWVQAGQATQCDAVYGCLAVASFIVLVDAMHVGSPFCWRKRHRVLLCVRMLRCQKDVCAVVAPHALASIFGGILGARARRSKTPVSRIRQKSGSSRLILQLNHGQVSEIFAPIVRAQRASCWSIFH